MAVGLAVTKQEIDTRAGDTARALQKLFGDVQTLKSFLDSQPNADLITLGYSEQEVATLKTAVADLWQLYQIGSGQANLPQAKDFTVFVRQLWGVGAF